MSSDEYYSSSDEDELLELQPPSSGPEDYVVTDALRPPRSTTYSASHLYDVVWNERKQIAVIDSILRNFYIPPIIFSVVTYTDGSDSRTCIDGKQRLTSIRSFIEGRIPHRDHRTKRLYWFTDNPNYGPATDKKNLLPLKYRRIFENKQITCIEYTDLTFNDERDIFKRVQMGVPLTPAEKMNVISTPRADFARDLVARLFSKEKGIGLQVSGKGKERLIPFDTTRGRDLQLLVVAIATLHKWDPETGCKTLLGTAGQEGWLNERLVAEKGKRNARKRKSQGKRKRKGDADDDDGNEDEEDAPVMPISDDFKKNMNKTLDLFVRLATDSRYNRPLQRTHYARNVSPLEMMGILVLIYLLRSVAVLNDTKLSELIQLLRAHLHRSHDDVRLNSTCGKTLFAFLLEVTKDPDQFLKEHRSLLDWASDANKDTTAKATKAKKGSTKRSRDPDYEGDVEMDTVSPVKKCRAQPEYNKPLAQEEDTKMLSTSRPGSINSPAPLSRTPASTSNYAQPHTPKRQPLPPVRQPQPPTHHSSSFISPGPFPLPSITTIPETRSPNTNPSSLLVLQPNLSPRPRLHDTAGTGAGTGDGSGNV
ncbi:hypothetical protein WG66_002214 [Moniliophthora roreri]|nr:hypothetical protein WG66_002214 [Moniliophthora roreri]